MPEGSEDPTNPFAPLQPTNSKSKKMLYHTHTHSRMVTHNTCTYTLGYLDVCLYNSVIFQYIPVNYTKFVQIDDINSDPLQLLHFSCTVFLLPAKVRRLYDIANVLSTLGLIKKRTFMAPNHRKMPGYAWCGPSMSEIEAIREYTYQFQHFLPLSCVTPHFSLPLSPSLFTSCVPEVRVQYGCPLLQEEGNNPYQKTFIHKQAIPASVRSPRYICTTSLSPPPSSPSCYPLFYSPNPLSFSLTLIILSHLLPPSTPFHPSLTIS